jgi:hypothetical protein
MPTDPFRQKGGLDNPFTWGGFVIIGIGVLIAWAVIYALTHMKFE